MSRHVSREGTLHEGDPQPAELLRAGPGDGDGNGALGLNGRWWSLCGRSMRLRLVLVLLSCDLDFIVLYCLLASLETFTLLDSVLFVRTLKEPEKVIIGQYCE